MKRFDMRIIFGLVLIAAGTMFMLQNLGFFYGGLTLLWAIMLGGAGITSLYAYSINRDNWWALIPAITLTAIGVSIVLDVIQPSLGRIFGGAIILGGIGLSFWMVFFTRRAFWWAIIPAGVLSSLAVISVLDEIFPRGQTDGLFLVGLGFTFLLLGILPGYEGRLRWAFIPGGILTVIGVLTLPFMESIFSILWPLALIGIGGYVIYKNYKRE
ncbi:MAG: hypothetical protein L3J16_02450 [Anaerolineales bacterium]|nr:hypothetical protein [Anaerolineales bacterium]